MFLKFLDKNLEIGNNDKIVARTKVTVPQDDGPILAESIIEAVPDNNNMYIKAPFSNRPKTPETVIK